MATTEEGTERRAMRVYVVQNAGLSTDAGAGLGGLVGGAVVAALLEE